MKSISSQRYKKPEPFLSSKIVPKNPALAYRDKLGLSTRHSSTFLLSPSVI